MNVYQTDKDGYFVSATVAGEDPRNPGVFLVPKGCVLTPPPQVAVNEIAQWVGGAWQKRPDFRGTAYWLADGSHHIHDQIGPLPAGALLQKPLVVDKAAKLAALDAERRRLETLPIAGTQGAKTFVISRPEKINEFLMGGLQIALDPAPQASFSMLDDNGVEVEYTKTLMGQIISFINSTKQPALKRYDARKAAIENAKDAAELAAVDVDLMKP